eukprot:TRINITY_DN2894_c0_g1_i1.p1 TRINITY_DN2894_c0_g1~~TRINITY_DN2894_c0_g1_i1.p1  ORF type:complete len:228 (+),score=48.10 TRINITY_DN2894_c0_g1_i1:54-737(+)
MFRQLVLVSVMLCLVETTAESIKNMAELGINLGTIANGNRGQKQRKQKKEFVCSNECLAKDCKAALTLRWGAYCGIGHSGCEGVKPCDAYDACCQKHDKCVDKDGGIMDADCHSALKKCLQKALKKGERTWSKECKAEDLVKTMSQGMDIANMFSQGLAGALGGGRHKHKMDRKNKRNTKLSDEQNKQPDEQNKQPDEQNKQPDEQNKQPDEQNKQPDEQNKKPDEL